MFTQSLKPDQKIADIKLSDEAPSRQDISAAGTFPLVEGDTSTRVWSLSGADLYHVVRWAQAVLVPDRPTITAAETVAEARKRFCVGEQNDITLAQKCRAWSRQQDAHLELTPDGIARAAQVASALGLARRFAAGALVDDDGAVITEPTEENLAKVYFNVATARQMVAAATFDPGEVAQVASVIREAKTRGDLDAALKLLVALGINLNAGRTPNTGTTSDSDPGDDSFAGAEDEEPDPFAGE